VSAECFLETRHNIDVNRMMIVANIHSHFSDINMQAIKTPNIKKHEEKLAINMPTYWDDFMIGILHHAIHC
jgi:malic enzyme